MYRFKGPNFVNLCSKKPIHIKPNLKSKIIRKNTIMNNAEFNNRHWYAHSTSDIFYSSKTAWKSSSGYENLCCKFWHYCFEASIISANCCFSPPFSLKNLLNLFLDVWIKISQFHHHIHAARMHIQLHADTAMYKTFNLCSIIFWHSKHSMYKILGQSVSENLLLKNVLKSKKGWITCTNKNP